MKHHWCLLLVLAARAQDGYLAYRMETVAGSTGLGDGGPALAAQIGQIRGVAVDRFGNLYLSDTDHHRVRKITNGIITTVAGDAVAGFAGDGGPATAARLNLPYGLAVDSADNLYIADLGNNRVRRVAPDGAISTIAGTGEKGSLGDGGPAAAAQLFNPRNVAVDSSGNLYISEFEGHRIRRVSPDGSIATVAGTLLQYPAGLAVDRAGALYVADSDNGRILRIAEGAVTTVAGGLQTPVAVAVDPAGGIYVADARAEVRTLTPTGAWTVFATLTAPHDVASDSGGNLYIADGVWIRRADTHGNVQTIAGDASEAALAAPAAVAVDGSGNLWIADPGAGRVRVVSPAGALRTAALAGASGIAVDAGGTIVAADPDHDRIIAIGPDGTVGNYAAATGPETALHGPRGVCANASAVFVADTANDRVLRVPPSGAVTLAAGSAAQLNLPGACAADGAGNLYIADTGNDRIRKVSPEGLITTVGNLDVHAPAGVAADDSGNLFVADTGGGRVLLVGADGTVHAIATGLSAPAGLALDSAGNLYVAESRAGLVRKLVRQDATAPVVLPPFSVVNAFSGQSGPVAPGELLTIAGAGLGPDAGTAAGLATSAAGVEVRFDGLAAPLLYVQAQQINVQAPYEIAGRESTHVEVFYQKQLAGAADVPVATAAPGLFPALTNPDGTPNGADSPAPRGAIMTFYATGAGLSDDGNVSGLPAGLALTHPRLPVTMTIGGFPAEILYAGSAPGLVGTMQVNARIPGGFLPPGAAAVLLNVGTAYARPVTIFVR